MAQTAVIARVADRNGAPYQQLAIKVLPLLVRQAQAGTLIFYSDLAAELEMPNERNLNYVLGSVGTSLIALGEQWGEEIPPLQAVVVNKRDGLPGPGFVDSVLQRARLRQASRRVQRQLITRMMAEVFEYPKWRAVLHHFGLRPVAVPNVAKLAATAPTLEGGGIGSGESEHHKALKEFVAANPRAVGVTARVMRVETEYRLPTGDAVDVLFHTRKAVIAIEVKSFISSEDDLGRGVFQCIKYDALLNAFLRVEARDTDVETRLIVGKTVPASIRDLAHLLGVALVEGVGPCPGGVQPSAKKKGPQDLTA